MGQIDLQSVLRHKQVWQGRESFSFKPRKESISTGYEQLDLALPDQGWTAGALTEIMTDQQGIGEMRLLIPMLAEQTRKGRWVAFIAPPYIPHAAGLSACGMDLSRLLLVHPRQQADRLWAIEQALRMGTCAAVVAWPGKIDGRQLRRLQLAAEEGGTVGVLLRSQQNEQQASPATVRLGLEKYENEALTVRFIKRRQGWPGEKVEVNPDHVVDESAFSLSAAGGL